MHVYWGFTNPTSMDMQSLWTCFQGLVPERMTTVTRVSGRNMILCSNWSSCCLTFVATHTLSSSISSHSDCVPVATADTLVTGTRCSDAQSVQAADILVPELLFT